MSTEYASGPLPTRRSTAKRSGYSVLVGIGLLLLFLMIANPLITVGAGQRAVLFSLQGGTSARQLGEGTHFIVPFVQSIIPYDVRTQTYTMSATSWEGEIKGDDSLTALTSDGQIVKVDVSVRYHPDPDKIYLLHQKIGPDYANKIIRPAARSQTRIVFAEYPVSAVFAARRAQIQNRLEAGLRTSLAQNNIILDEVLLRDLRFSEAYAKAIEQKQIAQQDAQRKDYELQKAQKEKLQRILEAQGDARSIELRGRAIAQNTRVVQYEYARKIAPNVSAIITDGRSINVPFAPPATGQR